MLSGSGTTHVIDPNVNGTIAVELPTGGSLVDGQVIEILCVGELGAFGKGLGGTFLSASNTNLVGPGEFQTYQFETSGSGATCRYRNVDPSTSGSVNPIWDVRLFGSGSFRV